MDTSTPDCYKGDLAPHPFWRSTDEPRYDRRSMQTKLGSAALFPDRLQIEPNDLIRQEWDELADGPPQLVAATGLVRVASWEWHWVRSMRLSKETRHFHRDAQCRSAPTPSIGSRQLGCIGRNLGREGSTQRPLCGLQLVVLLQVQPGLRGGVDVRRQLRKATLWPNSKSGSDWPTRCWLDGVSGASPEVGEGKRS